MLYPSVKQVSREDQDSEVGVSNAVAEGSVSNGEADDSFDGKETDKESKKKKNRCALCRKKVGLTGECECNVGYTMLVFYATFSVTKVPSFFDTMTKSFRIRVSLWRTVLRGASIQ